MADNKKTGLSISRTTNERVIIDLREIEPDTEFIVITMGQIGVIKEGHANLHFTAPRDVIIKREEILDESTSHRLQQREKRRPVLPSSHQSGIPKT